MKEPELFQQREEMGYPVQQAPQAASCVVAQQFCARHPIQLTMQRKRLTHTGGDFTVTDSNRNLVFKVAGKLFSLHDLRLLQDAAGNRLLTIKRKMFSLHRRWEAFRGNISNQQSYAFAAKKSSVFQRKTALDVFMAGNRDEKLCDFHVKGSYFDRSCTIYQGNRIVAEMKRKYTVKNVLLGKDTFLVMVQPGVDYAFIVALIVILDYMNE
ncbi:hypothetical protein SUGI_0785290 [Cryptomeria japonica]|uniref:protein LURP-one-related 15 n=1 Tax=Cryptomeria japonica TaxID=3369 RepID=UPI002414950A|nr:protein LURP-one-related 15 [Cryptomeria japonica]GLJ38538.1 hypothetical protein SUGI_0785290 [Cryptomeria japonica]